jgi:hypothetical protein
LIYLKKYDFCKHLQSQHSKKLRQDDLEFEFSLGYIEIPCLNKAKQPNTKANK